uniref:GP41 domain-containing protein n=1 Tax=Echinostoma caproni TaxID=27848 RepID=A0A183BAH6_9TREM
LKEGGVVDALTMRWWELNTVCTVNQLNYRSLNIEALEELYILVAVLVGIGVILISSEWFWAGVLWPQIRRRREKRAAQRARRERRIRRSQAIQARKSTAVELADNSEAGKPE